MVKQKEDITKDSTTSNKNTADIDHLPVNMCLQACSLIFPNPIDKESKVEVHIPIPQSWSNLLFNNNNNNKVKSAR